MVRHLHPRRENHWTLPSADVSTMSSSTLLQRERLCPPLLCAKWRLGGTEELRMLQSVSGGWKKQWLKPTIECIPRPTECFRVLLLSVQCIFTTYKISLARFLSSCFIWSRSTSDLEGSGERPQRPALFHSVLFGAERGKLLEVET